MIENAAAVSPIGAHLPTIMFFISEDWNVISHFCPLIREARCNELDVIVVTRVQAHRAAIEQLGARVIDIGGNLRSSALTQPARIAGLVAIIKREKPDIVHCVSIRMCVVGGIAARLAGVAKLILAPTGLGHVWIDTGLGPALMRRLIRRVVGQVLKGKQTRYLFENDEDPAELGLDPASPNVVIVGGAGVDPADFVGADEPAGGPVKVAVVARMTRQKGIHESIAAVELARAGGADIELHLFGDPDPANPSSLSATELSALVKGKPGVFWHGAVRDVAQVWRSHHIALLLSHREGLPRALIEAAACGRAIVATNVAGCRSVVSAGVEGQLVPLGDVKAAAAALVRLANDATLRQTLGGNAKKKFDDQYTETAVRQKIGHLYRELISEQQS